MTSLLEGAHLVGRRSGDGKSAGIAEAFRGASRAMNHQPKNPLHGITLAMIVEQLVERMGWEALGIAVPVRCFTHDPSIKSSLVFLRRTPWARAEVEALYLRGLRAATNADREATSPESARVEGLDEPT
jgi:uncharacterized protein (DUF2132 family)